jgi:nucleoside-diphosphate-sugar epimerase
MSYPVFDIANPVESLSQIIDAAAFALGVDDSAISYNEPKDPFASALCTSVVTSSERARDLLGWQARHSSVTLGMEVYMRAFLAGQVEKQ